MFAREVSADTLDAERLPEAAEKELEGVLADALVIAALLGIDHVRRETLEPGAPEASGVDFRDVQVGRETVGFDEAVEALRERNAVSREEFEEMSAAARTRAFAVARVAGADVLESVREALADAIGDGLSDAEASGAVQQALAQAGAHPLAPWHVDTVILNNAASAYSAGRWRQFRALGEAVAALEFVGVSDGRQSDVCAGYSGLVAPPEADVWGYASPPNHHRCRSTLRAILTGTAEAEGLEATAPEAVEAMGRPADGWDAAARTWGDLAALPEPVAARGAQLGLFE